MQKFCLVLYTTCPVQKFSTTLHCNVPPSGIISSGTIGAGWGGILAGVPGGLRGWGGTSGDLIPLVPGTGNGLLIGIKS